MALSWGNKLIKTTQSPNRKEQNMDESKREEMALFRYGINLAFSDSR